MDCRPTVEIKLCFQIPSTPRWGTETKHQILAMVIDPKQQLATENSTEKTSSSDWSFHVVVLQSSAKKLLMYKDFSHTYAAIVLLVKHIVS